MHNFRPVTHLRPASRAHHAGPMTDAALLNAVRPTRHIDDSNISWRRFAGYEGLYYSLLGVNEKRQKVDLYFRLTPGARCPSHRHVGPTDTLVVEGEHRTWDLRDGTWHLDQIRPTGFFAGNEGDHLHSEQGGAEGAIVLLSMQAVDGVIWETFDDRQQLVATTLLSDFARVLRRQEESE